MELITLLISSIDTFNGAVEGRLSYLVQFADFLSLDKSKYLFCFLLSYILAIFYRQLPSWPKLKHVYGLLFGVWVVYFVFGTQIWHSVFTSVVVYILLNTLPQSILLPSIWVFSLSYLTGCHIYRQWTSYMDWKMDFTTLQMLLTIKFTWCATDYCDMYKQKSPENASNEILRHMEQVRLFKIPTCLEYFSYIFWYSTILAGPIISPREHLDFVNMSMFPGHKVPQGSYQEGLWRMLYGLLLGVGVLLQSYFPLYYLLQEESFNHSLFYKILYVWIATALHRATYYFAWLLSEGSNIILGLGWNGLSKNGQSLWNRTSNACPLALETSSSFRDVVNNWNLSTNRWLKYYVYLRLRKGLKSFATHITFFLSAIWHGFYPGYYMSFGLSAFITEIFRGLHVNIRSRLLNTPILCKIYDFISMLFSSYLSSYAFAGFVLLGFENIWTFYSRLYWHGHVLILLTWTTLRLLPFRPKPPKPSIKIND